MVVYWVVGGRTLLSCAALEMGMVRHPGSGQVVDIP
jgi:hypothetical protein